MTPMHHFQTRRKACKQNQIMIPMVMRNLSSVKFLYINSYTLQNLYLEQYLIQLLTFVCGPLGMSINGTVVLFSTNNAGAPQEIQDWNLTRFYLSIYLQIWFMHMLNYNYTFTNVFLFVPVLLIQSYQVYSMRRFCLWHGGMFCLEISVAFSFVLIINVGNDL